MKPTPETYALAWVLDRLTSDSFGRFENDIPNTVEEIKKAIKQEPNRASSYVPDFSDESYPLLKERVA